MQAGDLVPALNGPPAYALSAFVLPDGDPTDDEFCTAHKYLYGMHQDENRNLSNTQYRQVADALGSLTAPPFSEAQRTEVVQICQQHAPAAAPPPAAPPAGATPQVLQALATVQQQMQQMQQQMQQGQQQMQQQLQVLLNRTSLQMQDARSPNSGALLPEGSLVPVPNRDSGAMPPANIQFPQTRAELAPPASDDAQVLQA